MLESEFIYEFVANKALKGFLFREGRVVPKMELTLEDNLAIDSTLGRICGPQINTWIRDLNLNKFMEKTLGQIDIVDIIPGSIIKLGLLHKEFLEIIYLGNCEFYVYNDSAGVLHPLDVLKALSLSFIKNDVVYFKVFRDGLSFPNDNLLFKSNICSITLVFTNIKGHFASRIDYKPTTKSLETVFAWKAESKPARFVEDDLTDSVQAIFVLDLVKNEYLINPQYSKHHYDDLAKVLKPVCNIRHSDNGLQTIMPGKFSLEQTPNKKSLYIRKKMEVGI